MKYIIANQAKAQAHGIRLRAHRTKDDKVILNEKEVRFCPLLSSYDTLEGKAAAIGGTVHSRAEIMQILPDYA